MKLFHLPRLLAGFMLALFLSTLAQAANSTLQVTVTLTIAADINVVWCASDGTGDVTTAQTWALGSVALGTAYDSDTQGTQPTLKYIQNNSNTTVDIAAVCGNSTSWSIVDITSIGSANQFAMESKVGAGAYVSIHSSVANHIANLTNGTVSGKMVLKITTPTSITIGGGIIQTITVTYTAAVDS
jgi:hypothetical protein